MKSIVTYARIFVKFNYKKNNLYLALFQLFNKSAVNLNIEPKIFL